MMIPPNKKSEMIIQEIENGEPNLNLVQDLITLGANLEWRDEDVRNKTVLHIAAIYGRVEIVRMLIDAKVELDIQDNDGWTALHWAATRGITKNAQILVDAGARKDIPDIEGKFPYDYAYTPELKNLLRP
jgi:ankyrin repeat protein